MKNLIFTGGGSGGHVLPALTIIKNINLNKKYNIHYIGGRNSIERELVSDYELRYYPIFTGKLRRYLSFENLIDIFKIILGLFQCLLILIKFKRSNSLVFSTGGFVSVPVVFAAKILGIKIYIHEQTTRVGLANKICSKLADKIFISFEDSFQFFDKKKTFYSGYPLRKECFDTKINPVIINNIEINKIEKPILFVTGGGNGAKLINDLIKDNLSSLLCDYVVIHQVGKANIKEFESIKCDGYFPLAFVGKEMIDLFKLSTVTFSRSGAGTVSELIAIGKRSIYVPLKIAQKNEQYHNAISAKKALDSIVITEDELTFDKLKEALQLIGYSNPIKKIQDRNGLDFLISEIEKSFNS